MIPIAVYIKNILNKHIEILDCYIVFWGWVQTISTIELVHRLYRIKNRNFKSNFPQK